MRIFITLLIVIAVAGWALTCVFTVDTTEYAVQMRFGEPVRTLIEPGLYAKWPWPADTVMRFDNRLMVLESPRESEPDKEYLTEDETSGIGKNVVATTYICWRVRREPAAVLRFLETMGDIDSAEARINDVVVAELGAALGQHDFGALVSTDAEQRRWQVFLDGVLDACRARVEDAYGLEIVDVRIARLNFPEQNRRNVFDRMRSERETIAARYRSEGEEQAMTIRAEANRRREQILAEATEQAERIHGEAEAEAARIYADAYGRDPEFYRFMRTLETYETTLTEDTVAILSGGSALFRLFYEGLEATSGAPDSVLPPTAAPPGEPPPDQTARKGDDPHSAEGGGGARPRSAAEPEG